MRKMKLTAVKCMMGGELIAQCKSSLHELKKRIYADDPTWHRDVKYELRPMINKSWFKRGLAIKYSK